MSLARDITTVGSATLASRLLGFLRDTAVAAMLGAGAAADAFFAVMQIVNLARRLLAEGALNSAFVPIWIRISDAEGQAGAQRFGLKVLGVMSLLLGLVTVGAMFAAPILVRLIAPGFDFGRHALASYYLLLALPYVAIAGAGAVVAAILNAQHRVRAVGYGVVVFNVVMLAAIGAVLGWREALPESVGAELAASIVLGGLAQLALVSVAAWRSRSPRTSAAAAPSAQLWRDVGGFFAKAMPGLIAAGIPQLKLMAGALVASASPSGVSWLYYANRLYELPLGVVSIAISAVMVPLIAASLRAHDSGAFAAAQSRAIEIALALAFPAAAGFAILSTPIAAGLFEHGAFGPQDTLAVAAALTAICVGLPGHALEKVFGAVAYAHEDTRTPMLTALAGLGVAILGSLILFPLYGPSGVAAAIGVSAWVGAALLGLVLLRRGWLRFDPIAGRRLPRILLATLAMAVAIGALNRLGTLSHAAGTAGRLLLLAALVGAGLVVYLAALQGLGVARLADLVAAARKRA